MKKYQKSFPSLIAELFIVIVGILMAISIDTWWKNIEDRDIERNLLIALDN